MKNAIILAAAFVFSAGAALAEGMVHKVAVHVNENDPKVMNIALNNVQNLTNYYESKGDTVEVGDLVGKMGTTGRSTGYHLHFEVFFNGKAYDPVKFLKAGRHVHEE